PIIKQLCERLAEKPRDGVSVLVVVPTRELAQQVAAAFDSYSRYAPAKVTSISLIGGESVDRQLRSLVDGANVVVATPGRLLDIIGRDGIDLSALDTLVLDEADKLLDLGFSEELQSLLRLLPEGRQNLLFSATLAPKIVNLGGKFLKDPIRISLAQQETSSKISQRVIEVNRERRRPLLHHLIVDAKETWQQVLVFVASKRSAHNLSAKLRGMGLSAAALHGDLAQSERTRVLKQFKNKKQQVLVATDLACRGIDISELSCVVNFDLPRSPNDYVHRIGRTGRAGQSGVAISFVDHETEAHFRLIEKRANICLEREQIEGFKMSPREFNPDTVKAPIKGKRKSKKDKLREQAARLAAKDSKPPKS
ncbi:MAG: DEAD/DEAH box helicase, partial [Kofleriaceae bacterium]|nr:DEAD/DEAH box helicase [Kofleriaceae bacterium]